MNRRFGTMTRTMLVAGLVAVLAAPAAEARSGGGKSFGSRGSSTYSAPSATPTAPRGARSLKDDEDVALLHDVTGLDADLDDGARLLGDDGDLHLHRLEQDEFVTGLDALADAHRDGVDVRDEVGCDVLCAHASIVAEARCYPRVRGVKPTRPFVEPVTGWVSPR